MAGNAIIAIDTSRARGVTGREEIDGVEWDHDPLNARNWTFRKKLLTAAVVSGIGFAW